MEKQNETAEGNAAQKKQQMQEQQPRCLFCGQPEQLIWVHGHGQCAHCGVNAMPCCDGAVCETN